LETVLGELRAEYEQDGKGRLFETLKPSLMGSRELQPYASLAAKLEMSEGAVKVAVHRLRERYRERLKSQIAQTVASPEDIAGEMRHLIRVLGRS
jgi:RNA polymerase sigma-70 factor (ECF subfamily)